MYFWKDILTQTWINIYIYIPTYCIVWLILAINFEIENNNNNITCIQKKCFIKTVSFVLLLLEYLDPIFLPNDVFLILYSNKSYFFLILFVLMILEPYVLCSWCARRKGCRSSIHNRMRTTSLSHHEHKITNKKSWHKLKWYAITNQSQCNCYPDVTLKCKASCGGKKITIYKSQVVIYKFYAYSYQFYALI